MRASGVAYIARPRARPRKWRPCLRATRGNSLSNMALLTVLSRTERDHPADGLRSRFNDGASEMSLFQW
jgi:hypothetical protein